MTWGLKSMQIDDQSVSFLRFVHILIINKTFAMSMLFENKKKITTSINYRLDNKVTSNLYSVFQTHQRLPAIKPVVPGQTYWHSFSLLCWQAAGCDKSSSLTETGRQGFYWALDPLAPERKQSDSQKCETCFHIGRFLVQKRQPGALFHLLVSQYLKKTILVFLVQVILFVCHTLMFEMQIFC